MSEGAYEFVDSVLSAGAMFDLLGATRVFAGELLGLTVGYATYDDAGWGPYEIQDLLAGRGIESSCWQILGGLLMWECPRDKARWAEAIMDQAGVAWWGGTAIGEPGMRYGAVFRGGHAAGGVHGG